MKAIIQNVILLYYVQKQPTETQTNFEINSCLKWCLNATISYRFCEIFYSYVNPYSDARDFELRASNDLATQ